MRAVAFNAPLPIADPRSLQDVDLPRPTPGARDLIVEVRAVSVNPVDTKVRAGRRPVSPDAWTVLGYDASGVVVETGPQVTGFRPGDEVFYAGAIDRPGTNAQFHAVDERIVGHKPASLGWAEAAAVPLTAITAWEMLFDRLDVRRPVPGAAPAVLIVGAAGGVGSIAVQLARHAGLTVIGTASRDDTVAWVRDLGADHVIDHRQPLPLQVTALDIGAPGFVFLTTHAADHLAETVDLIAPQGRIGAIDDPATLDVVPLKGKSLSFHWEFMFARSLHHTADMGEQGALLDEVARLIDAGTLRTTASENYGVISAANLRRAHALIESGKALGKIVLEGFDD